MYLWIVIATFIAMLTSFNLSVRPDMDRVFAETKASVVITKFNALHNGVKDYFNSQAPAKTGLSRVTYYPGDGVNVTVSEGGMATELTREQVAPYLPFGYVGADEELDDVASLVGGGSITSKVFCFIEGNTGEQCTSGVEGSCCSSECIADGECAGIYVVSFTRMPSRWMNKISNMPNADMMAALSHVRGYGKNIGYTETKDGKIVLSGGKFVSHVAPDGAQVQDDTFENWELFDAIVNDVDFQAMECNDQDVHCLFAIQQIYG